MLQAALQAAAASPVPSPGQGKTVRTETHTHTHTHTRPPASLALGAWAGPPAAAARPLPGPRKTSAFLKKMRPPKENAGLGPRQARTHTDTRPPAARASAAPEKPSLPGLQPEEKRSKARLGILHRYQEGASPGWPGCRSERSDRQTDRQAEPRWARL